MQQERIKELEKGQVASEEYKRQLGTTEQELVSLTLNLQALLSRIAILYIPGKSTERPRK